MLVLGVLLFTGNISYIQTTLLHSRENGIQNRRGGDSLLSRWVISQFPISVIFMFSIFISLASPVDVPVNGAELNYDGPDQREEFTYANVRRASYRGT